MAQGVNVLKNRMETMRQLIKSEIQRTTLTIAIRLYPNILKVFINERKIRHFGADRLPGIEDL